MDNMSREVKKEEANGKIIKDHVLTWQHDVEEEIQKTPKELSPASCSCIPSLPIPNPVSRFRQGRNALKKATAVAQLTSTGKDHLNGGIADLPPFQNKPKPDTAFEEFESRKDVYKKLWDALVNEDGPLIHGIYGMAGVGKTRMMEKIWEDATRKEIFKMVVRVNVGNENVDSKKLQDQVAGLLNCHLESQDVERRASQLESSLRNGGKILLILDDVWRDIPLDDIIGTPFGDGSSKGSKILFTSRESVVLKDNKCEHLVEIKTLSSGEALNLFMNTVGPDTIKSLQDESLVQKVCDECGQLPLLIHAVGKALKGKLHVSWKDAHDQLKKGKFEKIPGVPSKVYTGIKLSIDCLEHDAKSCLFLCSLFPEDAKIDMKMLIQLATGSRLIPDDEESRVLNMVDSLKTSSLLLGSGEDNETKLHDIIRDVARSMASTDSKYAFLQVTCNSAYLPSTANYCSRKFLRLDAETADVYFNEDLECPDLHTLWLQCNFRPQRFSGGFFRMFENLSFLMLQNVNISLEQFSLQPLGKLETLCLIKCDIRKTDVSLFPKNLKTLCIWLCNLPKPLDVANLKYLRKLEIQAEPKFVMVSNSISSLSSLEELHIPNGFIIDPEKYYLKAIVMEIGKLTHLKSIQFHFYDDVTFQGTYIFSNIKRFNIYVGEPKKLEYRVQRSRVPPTKSIELYGNHWKSWEGLMARAEIVNLEHNDIEMSSFCNGHRGAFEDVKTLSIYECDNMGHLASTSHDEIQYSLQPATCFSKLNILKIYSCSKLKYLFCNNIAKSLVQLLEIRVHSCESMEAIILNDCTSITQDEIQPATCFSKLAILEISGCPKLKYIFCNSIAKGLVQLQEVHVRYCKSMEAIILNDGTSISQDEIHPATCFSKLTILKFERCPKLKYIFCNNIAKGLVQLQELRVSVCESMEAIILNDGTSISQDEIQPATCFSKLAILEISWCSKLKYLFCNNIAKSLVQLQKLSVLACESMEAIILNNGTSISHDEIQPETCFSELTTINISWCPKLKYLFCNDVSKSLVHLHVGDCGSLEAIILNDGTSDGEIINFSKLKSVMMSGLSGLRSFYAEKKNMHSASPLPMDNSAQYQPLFDGTVAFPSLEDLRIFGLPKTSVIWGKDCFNSDTLSSFCKLSYLCVYNCKKLEIVIPQVMLHRLYNLVHINLSNCSSLRTMFSPSVASDLTHLKRMRIIRCREMREIIEKGEQVITDDGILFPELTDLELGNLPSLTSFWCYQSGKANTCKVAFRLCRLSSIVLRILPNLKSFFHDENFEFYMPALRKVKVDTCGLSTLFRFSMFRRFQLETLEVMNCELLENIVEDLKGDEICDKIITLSQLTGITLSGLPNLKSFFHNANYEFHMPVIKEVTVHHCGLSNILFTRSGFKNLKLLEELSVSDCELLESIFEDARADETLDTSDKIHTLNRVSTVHFQGLPKFKSIFHGATYRFYMPVLKNVKIVGCGLSVLFTSSVFREMQQLEELYVSDCKSLEHIVEEVGGDEISEINGKSIESPKLSSITLKSLPNLKSFSCSPSYVFNMPKLHTLKLRKCPRIEYFSSSKTNTPAVRVYIEWKPEEGIQDLNDYIRKKQLSGSYLSDCAKEPSYSSQDRGSYLSDCAEEPSYSSQDQGTQSERSEEEEPQETETDQSDSSL